MEKPSSQKSEKNNSITPRIATFISGAVYGVMGASDITSQHIVGGAVLTGALEYAARPSNKGIGIATGSGVIAGVLLRHFLSQ